MQSPSYTLPWLFFGVKGRIARKSYCLAILFMFVLLFLTVYWAVQAEDDPFRLTFSGFAFIAVMIFNLWSILALSIKRLHDLNMPVALVILIFVPMVTWIAVLFLMIKASHPEANEHGQVPFGPST